MQNDSFEVETFPNLKAYAAYRSDKRLRICIATEEILGPVRNGGIASTYYHLAKGLAAQGHEVHVLYLKGQTVENETPEYWIEHFSRFGVALHYLEYAEETIIGPSQNWQRRYSAAYRWLRDQRPFAVVHTSEWRGGLVYALMAKKLGLAFRDTLFIVKTSSPHLWNRHYQMQPITKTDLLPASFAEQKCVELADMVIGGSAHLLCFMRHIGYQLPSYTFVQPNILDFSEIQLDDKRSPRQPGDTVFSKELTFFGRLEMRKGIELFCTALDLLELDGVRPDRVNFLGKYGEALSNQRNEKVADFIKRKSEGWAFEVNCITELNQPEALSLLCSRDMFAVMPSLIENSTMAVYEALENNIPFIATDVGGTGELIAAEDHEQSLVTPNAYALYQRLRHALQSGHRIAHASFDYEENLQAWYGFHAYLADLFDQEPGSQAIARLVGKSQPPVSAKEIERPTLEAIVLLREASEAILFAKALLHDPPDVISVLYTDPAFEDTGQQIIALLRAAGLTAHLEGSVGFASGEALNCAMQNSTSDACILCDGTTTRFGPGFCSDLRTALQHNQDALITSFVRLDSSTTAMPIGSDIISESAMGGALGPSIVCIPKALVLRIGGIRPYDICYGLLQEYILRAAQDHSIELLVIPECRLLSDSYMNEFREVCTNPHARYLRSMPIIESDGIACRKLGLLSFSGSSSPPLQPNLFRDKRRRPADVVWLIHADKKREIGKNQPRVVIGLDERETSLLLVSTGEGERSLRVNGVVQDIHLEQVEGEITLHRFDVPSHWEVGGVYNVKLFLKTAGAEYSRYVRIIKMSGNVFSAISGSPIPSRAAIENVFTSSTGADEKRNSEKPSSMKSVPFGTSKRVHAGKQNIRGLLRKFSRKVERSMRGYNGPPIKGSIPPQGLLTTNPQVLEGWAWDRSDTKKELTVVLELNGEPVVEAVANLLIERFGTKNRKLAHHGFRFVLTPEMKADDAGIVVKIKESGEIVRNGRLRYRSHMLVPALMDSAYERA